MKKFLYLFILLGFTVSCETARYVYDDVYDAAEVKSVSDEGYTDLIKDNEKDHKVVIDKGERTTFGGYYPSNQSGGTSFTYDNCNCNRHTGYFPLNYSYLQPGWIYSNRYDPFWHNDCSCSYVCGSMSYYNISFGNMYNLYGYYDAWGSWHSYYPWDYDPYGYYSFYYGWNGNYYNNNYYGGNGWFGNWNNSNSGSNNTSYAGNNHFYGHRNPSSTGSSNTTVYEHTVKGVAVNPSSGQVLSTGSIVSVTDETNEGTTSKPVIANAETTFGAVVFGGNVQSADGNTTQTTKPVSTTGGITSTTSTPVNNTTGNTTGTAGNHVQASNQFEIKYPTGVASKTGSTGQTTTTYPQDPVNQSGNSTTAYRKYTTTTETNSTTQNSTNSTSRNSNSGTYNYNSNTNSGSNNTTTTHRNTTSTTSGSSGSSSSSGGSRSTTTSRR